MAKKSKEQLLAEQEEQERLRQEAIAEALRKEEEERLRQLAHEERRRVERAAEIARLNNEFTDLGRIRTSNYKSLETALDNSEESELRRLFSNALSINVNSIRDINTFIAEIETQIQTTIRDRLKPINSDRISDGSSVSGVLDNVTTICTRISSVLNSVMLKADECRVQDDQELAVRYADIASQLKILLLKVVDRATGEILTSPTEFSSSLKDGKEINITQSFITSNVSQERRRRGTDIDALRSKALSTDVSSGEVLLYSCIPPVKFGKQKLLDNNVPPPTSLQDRHPIKAAISKGIAQPSYATRIIWTDYDDSVEHSAIVQSTFESYAPTRTSSAPSGKGNRSRAGSGLRSNVVSATSTLSSANTALRTERESKEGDDMENESKMADNSDSAPADAAAADIPEQEKEKEADKVGLPKSRLISGETLFPLAGVLKIDFFQLPPPTIAVGTFSYRRIDNSTFFTQPNSPSSNFSSNNMNFGLNALPAGIKRALHPQISQGVSVAAANPLNVKFGLPVYSRVFNPLTDSSSVDSGSNAFPSSGVASSLSSSVSSSDSNSFGSEESVSIIAARYDPSTKEWTSANVTDSVIELQTRTAQLSTVHLSASFAFCTRVSYDLPLSMWQWIPMSVDHGVFVASCRRFTVSISVNKDGCMLLSPSTSEFADFRNEISGLKASGSTQKKRYSVPTILRKLRERGVVLALPPDSEPAPDICGHKIDQKDEFRIYENLAELAPVFSLKGRTPRHSSGINDKYYAELANLSKERTDIDEETLAKFNKDFLSHIPVGAIPPSATPVYVREEISPFTPVSSDWKEDPSSWLSLYFADDTDVESGVRVWRVSDRSSVKGGNIIQSASSSSDDPSGVIGINSSNDFSNSGISSAEVSDVEPESELETDVEGSGVSDVEGESKLLSGTVKSNVDLPVSLPVLKAPETIVPPDISPAHSSAWSALAKVTSDSAKTALLSSDVVYKNNVRLMFELIRPISITKVDS